MASASFTVKATQTAATAVGMAMTLKVITGAATAQPGISGSAQFSAANPAITLTPAATGSVIYGAILGGNANLAAASGTTFIQQASGNSLRYVQFEGASTTATVAQTLGATGGTTGLGIAAAEILAGPGLTLAEDASSPVVTAFSNTLNVSTATFTPPLGSLLVLMVASNGGTGTTTISVTDTAGQGLVWTAQAEAKGSSKGYAGLWTAQMPAPGGFFAFFR